MGKEIRYILLSFSVVLAIFIFAFLWQVRPGYEDEILAQARERQNEQLVNVPEPLDTDPATVESLDADDVAAALLADDAFLNSVAEKVGASVPGYVEQYAEAYVDALPVEFIDGIAAQVVDYILADQEAVLKAIDARTEDVVNGILAEKEAEYSDYIANAVASQVEAMRAGLESDILAATDSQINKAVADAEVVVDQKIADAVASAETEVRTMISSAIDEAVATYEPQVQAMISSAIDDAVATYEPQVQAMISSAIDDAVAVYEPQVQAMIDSSLEAARQELATYIADNKDAFAAMVAQNVATGLVEASARKTGDTDYDRVVYQVSADVVGAIGAKDAKTFENLDSYKENTYAAIENIVLEVMSRLEEKYASAPATYEAPATGTQAASEPSALITRPSFSFSTPSAGISGSDYAADREEVRRAEIRRVLDGLMN